METTIKELISVMEDQDLNVVAHITISHQHEYNLTLNQLNKMDGNKDITVLKLVRGALTTKDVFGHIRSKGKSKLYNVQH